MGKFTYFQKKTAAIALSKLIVYSILKKKQKKRKCWTRKWLLRRNKLGCYENLMRELLIEDTDSYKRWLRMDASSFQILLEKIDPYIKKQDTVMREAIPVGERLAITLRFLATGETQSSLAFQFRVAQNTISGIIPSVCQAIYNALKNEFLKVPENPQEWENISAEFLDLWNFPNCIGALDGKHINIAPPPSSGSKYYNYKNFFSIVLLGLVDANLKFIYVDVGTNGRISDGGVWNKSALKRNLDAQKLRIPGFKKLPNSNISVPHVIVADDAFPLSECIMKPYPGISVNLEQRIFNYRLSRARRVSENAFGILSSRFRVFQTKIHSSPAKVIKIVLAACCLHNFLRTNCEEIYSPMCSVDREDINDHEVHLGNWRELSKTLLPLKKNLGRGTVIAKEIRTRFTDYFNGPGSVPWQENMSQLH